MLRTCLLLLVVHPFAGIFAQEAPPHVRATVDVTLVEIPVHVVDRNGEPVRGLTAANFEILDRGKKRQITSFEVVDVGRRAKDAEAVHPAARRNLLLLFDLNHSTPPTLERARSAAETFLLRNLRPDDLAGVATFSVDDGFRILINFTADRELLKKAVAEVGTLRQFRVADPLLLSIAFEPLAPGQVRSRRDEDFYRMMRPVFIGGGQTASDDIQRARIRRQLAQFADLGRALDAMRGMKQIILLSEGFDAKFLQGRAAGQSENQAEEFTALTSGTIWEVDNDRRFGSVSARAALEQMTQLFRRSDVVLHAFDVGGMRPANDARSGGIIGADEATFTKASSNDSLFLMANGTGGRVFKNENDMRANFDRLNRQQEVTYILGFQISRPSPSGEFHDVQVRLRNAPGARAYHRAGYWDSSERSALARTFSLAEIIVNDIPQHDLELDLLAVPFARESQADVAVVLEIDGASILRNSRDGLFVGDLFVYAFDEKNQVADSLFQRLSVDTSKVHDQLSKRGVKFYGSLGLAPGTYTLKTVVHSTTSGGNGYEKTALHVPTGSDAWFPMIVDRAGDWVLVRGTPQADRVIPYHFEFAGQGFMPAAMPVLTSSSEYQLVVASRETTPHGTTIGATIVGPQSTSRPADLTLVESRAARGHEGMMLLFRFVPPKLEPGSYTLELADADQVASIPFMIR